MKRSPLLASILTASICVAAPPWAADQTIRHFADKIILVNCRGEGLAKDLSFQNAIQQCNALAANEINNEFKFKSVVIETEKEGARLYSEISSQKQVTGLTPKTEREFSEFNEGGFTTWLQVRYDLKKAKVETIGDEPPDFQTPETSVETLAKEAPSPEIKKKSLRNGSQRTLTLMTFPEKCSDYIVRGKNPRSHSCNTNPVHIMVNVAEDTEIILRPSSNSFRPKTLKVQRQREPANGYDNEVLDVQFERK